MHERQMSRGEANPSCRSAGDHELKPRIGDHMNEWLKPHIQETQAGMEITSYLPAELDFA
jgi:coenzyme PQQ precursor peptide PqqA